MHNFQINLKSSFFISNCPCRDDDTGKSLFHLLNQSKNDKVEIFQPKDIRDYLQELVGEMKVSSDEIRNVLRKTEVLLGPGLEDINSKVVSDHLGNLKVCAGSSIEKLRIINRRLDEKIHLASSRFLEGAIKDYAALANGEFSIRAEEINAKRITKPMIENIVTENLTPIVFLNARSDNTDTSHANSNQLMRLKMSSGFIDVEQIEIMDDLRSEAEDYFFTNNYRRDDKQIFLKEFNQIKKIVQVQSVEAKSRNIKEDAPYGTDMLHSIEDRIKGVSINRSEDVFNCPYEILKGVVGILTNECKVSFSKEPPGGWANNVNITD